MKTKLTVEQSQHLIDLGVPKEKASGAISVAPMGYDVRGVVKVPAQPVFKLDDFLNGEILPTEIKDEFGASLNLEISMFEKVSYVGYWEGAVDNEYRWIVKDAELIDALYELACWYYGEYLKSEKK